LTLKLVAKVWALGGFDSIGALAGEVKPGLYLKGVILTIPFSVLTYLGPSLLCLVAVPNFRSDLWSNGWSNATQIDGGYPSIAKSINPWLGVFMTVCALLAMFGQVVAGILSVARQVWACGGNGMLPR
jgi:amino acid transporter